MHTRKQDERQGMATKVSALLVGTVVGNDGASTPLLIDLKQLATLLSCGQSTLHRNRKADRLPAPIKLGGRTLWRVQEIEAWVAAGCPDRKTWEAMQTAAKRR